jgi:hypothetical protein
MTWRGLLVSVRSEAEATEVIDQLQDLAERQARVQKATYDISTGRNK